jgi:hypothetical protein
MTVSVSSGIGFRAASSLWRRITMLMQDLAAERPQVGLIFKKD